MKNRIILFILFLSSTNIVLSQTREQQRRADSYYQNQQSRKQKSGSLDWLFSSANSNYSRNSLIKEEYNDGSWYSGQGNTDNYIGLGIHYHVNKKSSGVTYTFSYWKNSQPSGLTFLLNTAGNSFFGQFVSGKKSGFGISKWSKDKPLNLNNYTDVIKYVGEYKEGNWHGYGIVYFKDGTYKSGIWIDDVLSKELPKLEVLENLGF